MRVKVLKVKTAAIDAINSKTWPADWVGEVDDKILATWGKGEFEPAIEPVEIAQPIIPAAAMTAQHVAVLVAAADEAMAAVAVTPKEMPPAKKRSADK